MKRTDRWIFILIITTLSYSAFASRITVNYEYNTLGICVGATARIENAEHLIGEAKLEELVKGDHYRVRLWHYSENGEVIYEAVTKYAIHSGMKISEQSVRGKKKLEIFQTWPTP